MFLHLLWIHQLRWLRVLHTAQSTRLDPFPSGRKMHRGKTVLRKPAVMQNATNATTHRPLQIPFRASEGELVPTLPLCCEIRHWQISFLWKGISVGDFARFFLHCNSLSEAVLRKQCKEQKEANCKNKYWWLSRKATKLHSIIPLSNNNGLNSGAKSFKFFVWRVGTHV